MFDVKDIPIPPEFSEEQLKRAKDSGHYEGIFFEWYKYAAQMAALISHIQKDSPAFRKIPNQHYHVLIGLLNRCARLMLATLALSHEGKFGETTVIIDRCVNESGMKLIWLCTDLSQEKFNMYLADGLKADLELKGSINKNIAERQGNLKKIEERMLASINDCIRNSELTEEQISSSKKLPNTADILTDIGFDRLMYISVQKMGSHHVHGTWTSLLSHYLEKEDGGELLLPRGNNVSAHSNQFAMCSLIVLKAARCYCAYALDESGAKAINDLLEYSEKEITEMLGVASMGDFENIEQVSENR